MQRTGFTERKTRVLAAHAAARQRKGTKPARRVLAVTGALAATVVCFFLLKGATLAWHGENGFVPHAEGASALRLWLTGVDPLTRLIADVLGPAHG